MNTNDYNERRQQLLGYLFERSGGRPFHAIPTDEIERDLGLQEGDVRHMHAYGLLKYLYVPFGMRTISLNPDGVALATTPDPPLTNIVHAPGAQNVAIMQGNTHSSQTVTFRQSGIDARELSTNLASLLGELEQLPVPSDENAKRQAIAQVKAMAELAAAPDPEPGMLSTLWAGARRTLGAAALGYAVNQAPNAHHLIQAITGLLGG